MGRKKIKTFSSSKAAEYRTALQEKFAEELECQVPDKLFERLYHDATCGGFPDPDDLVCEFEAYEYNNSHIQGRINCLETFLSTRQAKYKMKREEQRHENIVKAAIGRQMKTVNKEMKEVQSGLENLKTKTIKNLQCANSDLKAQVSNMKTEVAHLRKKMTVIPQLEQMTKEFKEQNKRLIEENKQLKTVLQNSYSKSQIKSILKDLREKCKKDMDRKLERGMNKLRTEFNGFNESSLHVEQEQEESPEKKAEAGKKRKYMQSPKYTEPLIVNMFHEPKPRNSRYRSKARKSAPTKSSSLQKDTMVSKARRRQSLDRIQKLKVENVEVKRLGRFQFGSNELGKASGRAAKMLHATMKSRKRGLESAALPKRKRLKPNSSERLPTRMGFAKPPPKLKKREKDLDDSTLAAEIEELMEDGESSKKPSTNISALQENGNMENQIDESSELQSIASPDKNVSSAMETLNPEELNSSKSKEENINTSKETLDIETMDLEPPHEEKIESKELVKEDTVGVESISAVADTLVQEKKDESVNITLDVLPDDPDNSSVQVSKKEIPSLLPSVSTSKNEVAAEEKTEIKSFKFSPQMSLRKRKLPSPKTFKFSPQKQKMAEDDTTMTSEQTHEADSDETFFLNLANESLVDDLDEPEESNTSKKISSSADVAETKENFENNDVVFT